MGQPRAQSPSCEPVSLRVKRGRTSDHERFGWSSISGAPRTTPSEFRAPGGLGGGQQSPTPQARPHGPVAGTVRAKAELRVRLAAALLRMSEGRNPDATLLLEMASQGRAQLCITVPLPGGDL